MAKKYHQIRVPEDVWEIWKKRKDKIQDRIKSVTNKNNKVHLTNVLRYYGNRKVDIWDEELVNYFNNKKKKKNFKGSLI